MNVNDGTVISRCLPRYRHQEWLNSLNEIKQNVPLGRELHLICDNDATRKHPKVLAWTKRNGRFHFHFTRPPPRG